MDEFEQIRGVLDSVQKSLPAFPRTVGMHFDVGADIAGDPAVYVVVLLDENTRQKDWTNEISTRSRSASERRCGRGALHDGRT
jgi:hypothetical protein